MNLKKRNFQSGVSISLDCFTL